MLRCRPRGSEPFASGARSSSGLTILRYGWSRRGLGGLSAAPRRYRGPLVFRGGLRSFGRRRADRSGTAVAALVRFCSFAGWWLRLRGQEVLAGVAVYGVVVAGLDSVVAAGRVRFLVFTMAVARMRLGLVRRRVWDIRYLSETGPPCLSTPRRGGAPAKSSGWPVDSWPRPCTERRR
jgi:hypothetical protein